jgi:hypothetical protein
MASRYTWSWAQQALVQDKMLPTGNPNSGGNSPTTMRKRLDEAPMAGGVADLKKKANGNGISKKIRKESSMKKGGGDDKGVKRVRESYACLRHRAMHKRCPADCPDRRIPKPLPVAQERKQVQQQQLQQQLQKNLRTTIPAMLEGKPTADFLSSFHPPLMGLENLNWEPQIPTWDTNNWEESKDNWTQPGGQQDPSVTAAGGLPGGMPGPVNMNQWNNGGDKDSSSSKQSSSEEDEFFSSSDSLVDYWLDPNASFSTLPSFQWNDPNLLDFNSNQNQYASPLTITEIDMGNLNAPAPAPAMGKDHLREMLFRILISRDTLERWVYDPYFNKLLRGFYVRVRIGENNGVPIHRIGSVLEGRDSCYEVYRLGRAETTKGFVVSFGSYGQHIISLASVSNKPPSDEEYEEWKREMEKSNATITLQEVQDKADIIQVLNMKHQAYASH